MAKQAVKKASQKKAAAKRELIAPRGDKRYIRRDAAGRIKESDDLSRSLSQGSPQEGDQSGKARTRRSRRPQACREESRPENIACQAIA